MFFQSSDWQSQYNNAIDSPLVPHQDPGIGVFGDAFHDMTHSNGVMTSTVNLNELWGDEINRFQKLSGQIIPHTPQQNSESIAVRGRLREYVDAWNKNNPDKPYALPSDEEMHKRMLANIRSAQIDLEVKNQSASESLGGNIGTLGAGITSTAIDPANAASIALFAAAPESGFLRGILGDAVGMGVGSGVNEGVNYNLNRELDPNYTLGDSARNVVDGVLQGAVGGAVIRGAGKAIGYGVSRAARMFRDARTVGFPLEQTAVDAGHVVDEASHINDSNPLGPEGETPHAAAMSEAYRAASVGEAPVIPQEVSALASETPMQTVNRQLREDAPELMDRLDNLNLQKSRAEQALSDLRSQADAPEFMATRRAIAAANEQADKVDRLQSALDKSKSPKEQARLAQQLTNAKSELATRVQSVNPDVADRLELLEKSQAARQSVYETVKKALADHEMLVDAARKERLEAYWSDRSASAKNAPQIEDTGTETGEGVSQVRQAVMNGKLPPGADIDADLKSARSLVAEANAQGVPLNEYLAGKSFMDGVTPRVRAMIGLMHDGPDLAYRVPEAEFGQRVKNLADSMTGEKPAVETPASATTTPEIEAAVEKAIAASDPVKMADDPEIVKTVINDGAKMVAEMPDITLRNENGETVKLSDILKEADEHITAADELRACALGERGE